MLSIEHDETPAIESYRGFSSWRPPVRLQVFSLQLW